MKVKCVKRLFDTTLGKIYDVKDVTYDDGVVEYVDINDDVGTHWIMYKDEFEVIPDAE